MPHAAPTRARNRVATVSPPAATAIPVPTLGDQPGAPPADRRPARSRRVDAYVAAGCLLGALYVTGGLWADPSGSALTHNVSDQVFFEWLLGYIAHAVTHLGNPLWTSMLNAPTGVNLASNTAVTVIGVLLTPVTLLFGAPVAFITAITLNLGGTAYAWYWLLSRHVARTRTAAIVGGVFCGFAPGMISQANGHLNFTAGWIIPVLLWRLVRLTRSPVGLHTAVRLRDGAWVGLLAAVQYSLSAEMLFFTGVAATVFVAAWTVQRPDEALAIARGARRALAAGVLVAGAVLAYPIWMQFAGPRTYHGSGFTHIGVWENAAAFGAYPWESLAGGAGLSTHLSLNYVEENSYLGPVLLVAAVIAALWWSRRPAGTTRPAALGRAEMRALSVTGVFIAVSAMGPRLQLGGWHSHIPMPWAILARLPFFDAALPGRFALLLIPIVALIVTISCDEVLAWPRGHAARKIALAVVLTAFVPLLPLPLPTQARAALPQFITSGDWRGYLAPGSSMISIPPSSWDSADAQRWQAATGFAFPIEGGYFLGVGADGRSMVGPVIRPTSALLTGVARDDVMPQITDADRATARTDLVFWRAGLVVLPDATPGLGHPWAAKHDMLLAVATELLGTPTRVDDVWLWRAGSTG